MTLRVAHVFDAPDLKDKGGLENVERQRTPRPSGHLLYCRLYLQGQEPFKGESFLLRAARYLAMSTGEKDMKQMRWQHRKFSERR